MNINTKEHWEESHEKYYKEHIIKGYESVLAWVNQYEKCHISVLEILENNLNFDQFGNKSFLELGCGSPLGNILFFEKFSKELYFKMHYWDFSLKALQSCQELFGTNENLFYKEIDLLRQKIEGEFGIIAIVETLEHFEEPYNWDILTQALNHAYYVVISTPTDTDSCNGEHVSFYRDNPIGERFKHSLLDWEKNGNHRTILLKGNLFSKQEYQEWLEKLTPTKKEIKDNVNNISESEKCLNLEKFLNGNGLEIGFFDHKLKRTSIGFDKASAYFDKVGGINFIGDAGEKLPFANEEFDYIFSSHCLEHIQAPLINILQEWLRVLKKNGILALYLPHKLLCGVNPENGQYLNLEFGFGGHYHAFDQYDILVALDQLIKYKILHSEVRGEPLSSNSGFINKEYSFELVIQKVE